MSEAITTIGEVLDCSRCALCGHACQPLVPFRRPSFALTGRTPEELELLAAWAEKTPTMAAFCERHLPPRPAYEVNRRALLYVAHMTTWFKFLGIPWRARGGCGGRRSGRR